MSGSRIAEAPAKTKARAGSLEPAAYQRPLLIAMGVLALYLVLVYPQGFQTPFMADDFVFLEKVRGLSFGSLWRLEDLHGLYYRPWSRELQYWLWPRAFGLSETPFHVVAFALCLASLGMYFELVRRIAGIGAAAIATAAVAALAPWSPLLLWVAGLQDLWMLASALAALLAFVAGRRLLAAAFLVIALLSKETAAVVPAVATLHALLVDRHRPVEALRRTAPLWIVVALWVAFHPAIGGRLLDSETAGPTTTHAVTPKAAAIGASAALVNLDQLPSPTIGWSRTLQASLVGILPLAGLMIWAFRSKRAVSEAAESRARASIFGAAWFLVATLPLLAVTAAGWHTYYALLGMMGAWLALAVWVVRSRWVALTLITALVVVRTARATTLSSDWGSEWYQARAAIFMLGSRAYFQSRPPFPPHSRVYLSQVPGAVGMVPGGESIVMQVWKRDTTIRTFYGSSYQPRAPHEPAGQDFYFTYDQAKGWQEDPEPVITESSGLAEREKYAMRMSRFNRLQDTLAEYLKLAKEHPQNPGYLFNVGSCYYRMGDSVEAARWYQRAAEVPGSPDQIKKVAARTRYLLER